MATYSSGLSTFKITITDPKKDDPEDLDLKKADQLNTPSTGGATLDTNNSSPDDDDADISSIDLQADHQSESDETTIEMVSKSSPNVEDEGSFRTILQPLNGLGDLRGFKNLPLNACGVRLGLTAQEKEEIFRIRQEPEEAMEEEKEDRREKQINRRVGISKDQAEVKAESKGKKKQSDTQNLPGYLCSIMKQIVFKYHGRKELGMPEVEGKLQKAGKEILGFSFMMQNYGTNDKTWKKLSEHNADFGNEETLKLWKEVVIMILGNLEYRTRVLKLGRYGQKKQEMILTKWEKCIAAVEDNLPG